MSFHSLYVTLLVMLLSLCNAQTEVGNSTFQVGVILDLDSLVGRTGMTSLSLALSDFYSLNPNYTTKLVLHVRNSSGQVIDAAASALNLLRDIQVDAIIGPQKSSEASFVIGLGDRANVPIISFSATSPFLHPQTPYFVQAALNDAAQVGALAAIVEYFQWSQVVLIYEESDYGNGIIPSLANAFQDVNARISYRSSIPTTSTDEMLLKELYKMKTMQTRVFVVHLSSVLASRLFLKAKEAGMMSVGYAWIVTSSFMDLLYSLDSHVVESMQGVIGVKPLIPGSPKLSDTAIRWKRKFLQDNPKYSQVELSLYGVWAYDTLWALAMAAEEVQFRNRSSLVNSTNPYTTELSETGPKILEAISGVTFQGLGGNFHLVNGQIETPAFQILNVIGNGEREVGIWTPSQGMLSESNVNITNVSSKKLKNIIFPGDSTLVPKGWELPVGGNKLKIGVPVKAGFQQMLKVEKNPETNALKISGCYKDMFDAVMAALPYAVPYEYFPFENVDGSSAGSYDELTHQVSFQNYEGAVGDISITSNRSSFVDFTLPFTEGGVNMVILSKNDDPYNESTFLRPFKLQLWLSIIALFIFTGLALWVLEHRFNSAYRGTPAQHAGMIFYFPFMSIVYANREKIVTNLARIVVVVWVLVILIVNSTYTANLSAILTTSRLQPVSIDANELKRNGDHVGCRNGSFTCNYLQASLGFDKSKIKPYNSPEDVHKAFTNGSKNGGITAFFSNTPYTKLFLSQYCGKYRTVDPVYPSEGFAFVFTKGSPLVADVSRAVIKLTENGTLSNIESRWMPRQDCNGLVTSSNSNSVPLRMFKIPFAITVAVTTMCLAISLATYVYRNRDFIHRISNSGNTTWSKVRAISKHFDQRDPKSFRSSKPREDEEPTSPSAVGNPGSATVVPISDIEMGIALREASPSPPYSPQVNPSDQPRSSAPRDSEHNIVIV